MVSLYEIFKDKYGEYYISYGKKHRIKTLEKKNNKIDEIIDKLQENEFDDSWLKHFEKYYINYKIIFLNNKKYIQFG